jgi:hypothetical protein
MNAFIRDKIAKHWKVGLSGYLCIQEYMLCKSLSLARKANSSSVCPSRKILYMDIPREHLVFSGIGGMAHSMSQAFHGRNTIVVDTYIQSTLVCYRKPLFSKASQVYYFN